MTRIKETDFVRCAGNKSTADVLLSIGTPKAKSFFYLSKNQYYEQFTKYSKRYNRSNAKLFGLLA